MVPQAFTRLCFLEILRYYKSGEIAMHIIDIKVPQTR